MGNDIKQVLNRLKKSGFGDDWVQFISPLQKSLEDGDHVQIIIKQGDGYHSLNFVLDIAKQTGELSFPSCKGTSVRLPDFQHKVINGIDSEVLDGLMQRLDWKMDFVQLEKQVEQTGKGFTERIRLYHTAIAQVVMLAATEEGKVISDALKLRYLLDTPYESRYIPQELKNKYVTERTFWMDGENPFSKYEAVNLLEGRPVLKQYTDTDGNRKKEWFVATNEAGNLTAKEYLFSGGQTIYPNYGLSSVLSTLPMVFNAVEQKAATLKSLQQGDQVPVAIVKNGREETYFIEANPAAKNIIIYDSNHKRVSRKAMLLDYPMHRNKRVKGKHL